MERVTVIIVACSIVLGGCALFKQKDYYGEAAACGSGPECNDLWDAWDRHEDRLLLRKKVEAFRNSCPKGTYLICVGYGTGNEVENCVKKPKHKCQCSCGNIDWGRY